MRTDNENLGHCCAQPAAGRRADDRTQPGDGSLSLTDPAFTRFIGGTIEEVDPASLRVTIKTEQGKKELLTVADATNILLTVLVVAALVLMFFLSVTKRQIVIIQGEPGRFSEVRGFSLRRGDKGEDFAHQPVGESVHPYYIEISTKSC
jgi:hypothetical protein